MNSNIISDKEITKITAVCRLPYYTDIPDVGLLLDQTARLVNGYLDPLDDINITNSMISNYVKHQIIARPVKKLYYREQIASLIFIAIAKTVLSLEDINSLLEIQRREYSPEAAYNMFREQFEAALSDKFSTISGRNITGSDFDGSKLSDPDLNKDKASAASYEPASVTSGNFNTYLLKSLINAVAESIHLKQLIKQAAVSCS